MNMEFTFRKMMMSDKEDVLRICSKIWDGHDFLPSMFDEWVKDEKGYFAAALHEGKLVGMGRITFLTETDAWFEGLRKDQDADIKGMGVAVTRHLLDALRNNKNLTSIRFCTYFKNMGSVKAGEKCNFKVVQAFSLKEFVFEKEGHKSSSPSYAPVVRIDDQDRILAYVHKSDFIPLSGNFQCLSWIVHSYTDELFIREFIDSGQCYAIVENNEIKALTAIFYGRGFHLAFFDAENFSYAKSLLHYIHVMAHDKGQWGVEIFLPEYAKLKSWFSDFDYESWEAENDVLVFGHPVD